MPSVRRKTAHRWHHRKAPRVVPSPRRGAIAKILIVGVVLVGAVAGLLAWKGKLFARGGEKSNLIIEVVKKGPLEITITERGNLESANNQQLVCMVEGEAGAGILKIVDEGTLVEKDQVLVELDSSKLRNDATAQEIVVEQAAATLKTAEKNVEIQITQNDSDIAAAQLKLDLAKLDLKKYEEGEYEQQKNTIKGEIELAFEEQSRARDKYDFTKRLIKKGYAKQSEVEADRVALSKANINLSVAEEKLTVLNEFTAKRQIAEFRANATEFERELARVKLKADAALAKYEADLSAAKLKYEVEKSTYDKIQRQLEFCIIRAPRDGLVVYVNTRQGGFRGGSDPLIYEGAKVKERQPIINLPDVKNMQVNARIHESKISMVKRGLQATIHLDAKAGETYHGEVSMVSLVPTSGNWPNINLKEYITNIKLTDDLEKVSQLKPGLTAEVEILIDRLSDVLQVPVQSFVERGGRHFAWVVEGERLVRKEVKIGESNEQMTQIVSGLAVGEKVVQTPRTVIPKEIAQLEEDVPATVESATSGLKVPEPGQRGAGPPGEGGMRGGRGGRGGERGSPGEGGAGPGGGAVAGEGQPGGRGRGEGGQWNGGGRGEGGGQWGGGRGGGGGGRGGGDPMAFFQRMDQNGDGKVTEDEMPEFMKGRFAAMDTNGDKAIDKDEWQKAAAAFQAGGGRGGGGGGARPDAGGGQ
jgi:HlyD family secretion protein